MHACCKTQELCLKQRNQNYIIFEKQQLPNAPVKYTLSHVAFSFKPTAPVAQGDPPDNVTEKVSQTLMDQVLTGLARGKF